MPWPLGKPRGPSPFKGKNRSPYKTRTPVRTSENPESNPRPMTAAMVMCRDCGDERTRTPCPKCGATAVEEVEARSGRPRIIQ